MAINWQTTPNGGVQVKSFAVFHGPLDAVAAASVHLSATWNNAGVTFTSWLSNITNIASAADSKLADLQVGGSSKLSINKSGVLRIGNSAPDLATSFQGGLQIANSLAPSTDPAEGLATWADGTSDEWMYRTAAPSEGSTRQNRVHNRAEQVTGSGSDYTLTNATARVDFGTGDVQVDIPTGGTFLIIATVSFVGDAAGAGDELRAKLRNSTDAVDIGPEQRTTMPANNGFTEIILQQLHLNNLGTIQTVQIFAHNQTAARGTVSSTRTHIKFIRLY
jgi:hypothetical protein